MNNLNKVLVIGFVSLALFAAANSVIAKGENLASVSTNDTVLDYNERIHLGEGNYRAQVLSQEQVDEILDR